jgi:hypothetical protein
VRNFHTHSDRYQPAVLGLCSLARSTSSATRWMTATRSIPRAMRIDSAASTVAGRLLHPVATMPRRSARGSCARRLISALPMAAESIASGVTLLRRKILKRREGLDERLASLLIGASVESDELSETEPALGSEQLSFTSHMCATAFRVFIKISRWI